MRRRFVYAVCSTVRFGAVRQNNFRNIYHSTIILQLNSTQQKYKGISTNQQKETKNSNFNKNKPPVCIKKETSKTIFFNRRAPSCCFVFCRRYFNVNKFVTRKEDVTLQDIRTIIFTSSTSRHVTSR